MSLDPEELVMDAIGLTLNVAASVCVGLATYVTASWAIDSITGKRYRSLRTTGENGRPGNIYDHAPD